MPQKLFSVIAVTVAVFFVIAIITVILPSSVVLVDGEEVEVVAKGSILQFDKSLIVKLAIQWFNILLLTFILIRVLYSPVKKFMADRAERIMGDIDSARKSNQEAQGIKAKYEEKLANIEKEREEILVKAHREAVEEHDRILLEVREQAKHLLQSADEKIKMERENSADEVRRQIIEIASLMASRFVEVSIDNQTRAKYVEEALADWSEHSW